MRDVKLLEKPLCTASLTIGRGMYQAYGRTGDATLKMCILKTGSKPTLEDAHDEEAVGVDNQR